MNNNYITVHYKMIKLQRRFLSLLEFEAKRLLSKQGVNTQRFFTLQEQSTSSNSSNLQSDEYVIKAQVAAGGRGKGHFPQVPQLKSGILFSQNLKEAVELARAMNGQKLVTVQTGPAGEVVQEVMVAESVPELLAEAYVAFILQRGRAVLLASHRGGVDIESVPREDIFELDVEGCDWKQAAAILFPQHSGNHALMDKVANQLQFLKQSFYGKDLLQLEINPFCIVKQQSNELDVMCIDAKVEVDDNALFRCDFVNSASHQNSNFVKLDGGNLGCVVNGAGLAMATMDIVKLHGGAPANFLDLGGKATPESIRDCVLQASAGVQGVFINIFGGIVRCDDVATGLLMAKRELPQDLRMVVRLNGTNSAVAREMLQGVDGVYFEEDFDAAALLAVSLSTPRVAMPCC